MAFLDPVRRLMKALFGAPQVPAVEPESGPVALPDSPGPKPRIQPGPAVPGSTDAPRAHRPAQRFVLSVDEGGQFLVAVGDEITIGHVRTSEADLPFLADVGSLHVRLRRTDSLREGPIWRLAPLGEERTERNGAPLSREGARLVDGDLVRLGENLSFLFLVPDPASHTVLLELMHGAECAGAKTVCLLGEGEGGRLRIGAAEGRHVRIPNLRHEIAIVLSGGRLEFRSESGVQASGREPRANATLPFPPPQRFDLSVGRPEGSRPPFSISLSPFEVEESGV